MCTFKALFSFIFRPTESPTHTYWLQQRSSIKTSKSTLAIQCWGSCYSIRASYHSIPVSASRCVYRNNFKIPWIRDGRNCTNWLVVEFSIGWVDYLLQCYLQFWLRGWQSTEQQLQELYDNRKSQSRLLNLHACRLRLYSICFSLRTAMKVIVINFLLPKG